MPENPFDLADEDENEAEVESEANQSFAELRKAFKRSERQRKAIEAELEPLREFKAHVEQEQRKGQIETVFQQVGLSPKHAVLFERVNPEAEVTPEAVQAFASEYELVTQAGDPVSAPEQPQGFTPITTGTPPAVGTLTNDDVKSLLAQGRTDEVRRAYEQGRVEQVEVPWSQGQTFQ